MNSAHAHIDWVDGQPHSRAYDDIYFSSDNGLEETTHVFLAQNHLEQRWKLLDSQHFTIAETGFGTGLNFLCAWRLWNAGAPTTARLHFISIEKFPLTLADLTKALSLWPQLAEQRDQLLAQYQWLSPGFHRLVFDQGWVSLTLLIGDVIEMLPQIKTAYPKVLVDAWFLDGFSPAKNPEIWQQAMFDSMASLSGKQTTLATFTSAGDVRRGLESAGYQVTKVAGFGRKREMLCGEFAGSRVKATQVKGIFRPKRIDVKPAEAARKLANAIVKTAGVFPDIIGAKAPNAIVIGGGIAGAASSHALASRGLKVQLIERHSSLAQEASGHPMGVLYPRLATNDTAQSRLALNSFLYTTRLIQRSGLGQDDYDICGVLQLAFDARELARIKAIALQGLPADVVRYVDQDETTRLAGVELKQDALYFPAAGWVKPAAFCAALASHENINILNSTTALKIVEDGGLWQVWDTQQMLGEAPVVIIANANDANGFGQSAHLQLQAVRGQITCVESTAASQHLKAILCADGYISPAIEGQHCLGASFKPDDISMDIRLEDHQANLAMLRYIAPALHDSIKTQPLAGRAALRCATSDYLPAAGLLLDSEMIAAHPPRHNADTAGLPWLHGLYVNTGHGSKGLATAPLCAEIIASMICGEPSPVDARLLYALDPNRFLLRKLGLKRLLEPGRS